MKGLNMDYEGPFPEDEYGNTYVLTIIDTFTRAVGLYAVPNLEARHAARMLVRHIGIFGCPSQIVSDRGTHFTAEIIQELMVLVGINHVLTLAASKQENAAVENANKRSQEYLRSMLFDNRILNRWSDVLPLVQRIMMAEPNDVIGVSPAQLLFGNSIQLDRGIFLPNLPKEGVEAEQIGLIRCLKRSGCSLIRHNGYRSRKMLDIWRFPEVLLHALMSAPMS
jgi:transposase InsO family protein